MYPYSIATGDFDDDGKTDLSVVNVSSNNVSILSGNGAGGFSAPNNVSLANNPLSVAVGDLDRDGKADLAVANGGSNNVSVLIGNGTSVGTFASAVKYPIAYGPDSSQYGELRIPTGTGPHPLGHTIVVITLRRRSGPTPPRRMRPNPGCGLISRWPQTTPRVFERILPTN